MLKLIFPVNAFSKIFTFVIKILIQIKISGHKNFLSLPSHFMRKQTIFITIFTLLIAVLPASAIESSSPQCNSDLESEIRLVSTTLINAYLNADIETLENILSDDHVHNNVFGMSMNKEVFLKDIRDGILRWEKYEIPSMDVRIYGDVAIVNGIIDAIAYRNDNPITGKFRFTNVFAKINGSWKNVHFHNTILKGVSSLSST